MSLGLAERQPALPAAQRADPGRPRRGHRRSTSPAPSGCAPPPTRSCPRRRARAPSCTCRPRPTSSPAYWNASQAIAGVQLALGANSPFLLGKRAVARDPDPAVRAGHRHPQRGAEGAGRAAAGVVRRALDHLDLRPVRGERPLLPGAAAGHRRRGPARGARVRRHARSSPSCGCTTAPSTAGTARSTTSPTASRTCGSRTACCRRPDRRRHDGQRRLLLRPGARAGRAASGRCGRRCRSAPPRRTSTSPPGRASTRRSTGPGVGQVRATELVLRRLLPLARAGLDAWGVARRARATGCSGIIEQRCLTGANGAEWFVGRIAPSARRRRRPVDALRSDAAGLPRADAHQRARAHLGL